MMRLAFVIGLLAISLTSATPVRADFAVVTFNSGYCRVWTETAFGPRTGIICGSHRRSVGISASSPGKAPTWRCIEQSRGTAAITGDNKA
jgi:hypothetical protein